jgi:hypothetical protein
VTLVIKTEVPYLEKPWSTSINQILKNKIEKKINYIEGLKNIEIKKNEDQNWNIKKIIFDWLVKLKRKINLEKENEKEKE